MIFVITCIDEILRDWPLPENFLTDEAMVQVTEVVAAVAGEISQPSVHPIPVALTESDWNVATLRERVDSYVGEALMTQRNRLRVENQKTGLLNETPRVRRGISQAIAAFGPRTSGKKDDDTQADNLACLGVETFRRATVPTFQNQSNTGGLTKNRLSASENSSSAGS
ncbi:hypothetical protein [Sulfitobacter sp. CW3]|uniref:hypothetical protein n=1 Tax=Sulfitobacter sp. CW3 TaxID=2861965 RepID=UPI001C5DF6A7|nr:hypothetical protein [Sulfitobacter sp. CW3]MBW4963553.1 hypothetical protein [Sulfitobacter sp. CW3]